MPAQLHCCIPSLQQICIIFFSVVALCMQDILRLTLSIIAFYIFIYIRWHGMDSLFLLIFICKSCIQTEERLISIVDIFYYYILHIRWHGTDSIFLLSCNSCVQAGKDELEILVDTKSRTSCAINYIYFHNISLVFYDIIFPLQCKRIVQTNSQEDVQSLVRSIFVTCNSG